MAPYYFFFFLHSDMKVANGGYKLIFCRWGERGRWLDATEKETRLSGDDISYNKVFFERPKGDGCLILATRTQKFYFLQRGPGNLGLGFCVMLDWCCCCWRFCGGKEGFLPDKKDGASIANTSQFAAQFLGGKDCVCVPGNTTPKEHPSSRCWTSSSMHTHTHETLDEVDLMTKQIPIHPLDLFSLSQAGHPLRAGGPHM